MKYYIELFLTFGIMPFIFNINNVLNINIMEEYRYYKDGFEVSNMGNVKKDGEVLELSKGEYYYYFYINGKTERVHTIVGKLFPEICGEWHKYYHFHHLNRNQFDNRAENIVCLSPREHKILHQKEDGVSVGVKAYDLNGNFVGEWESKTQAAEATGIDYRHITQIILGKTNRYTAGKLYWFKSELTEEEIKNKILEIQSTMYQRNKQKLLN